jgi:hypothetical protein
MYGEPSKDPFRCLSKRWMRYILFVAAGWLMGYVHVMLSQSQELIHDHPSLYHIDNPTYPSFTPTIETDEAKDTKKEVK